MDEKDVPLSFREKRLLLEWGQRWSAVRRYLQVAGRLLALAYRALGSVLVAWIIYQHFGGGKK